MDFKFFLRKYEEFSNPFISYLPEARGGGFTKGILISNFIFWFQFPIYFGQDIIAQVSDVAHVPLVSFLKAFVNTFCITKIALMPS